MTVYGGAQVGGYRHFRTQAAWFINPSSGSDTADGATSGTAIKTHAELARRWGPKARLEQSTTVNILGDMPASDPIEVDVVFTGANNSKILNYVGGAVTPAKSGTIDTVNSNYVAATSYTDIDDASETFTGLEGTRFRRTSDNAVGWVWRVPATDQILMGPVCTVADAVATPSLVTLAASNAYVLETPFRAVLGKVNGIAPDPTGGVLGATRIAFTDLRIAPEGAASYVSISAAVRFNKCKLDFVRFQGGSVEFYACGWSDCGIANGFAFVDASTAYQGSFGGAMSFLNCAAILDRTLIGEDSLIREIAPLTTVQYSMNVQLVLGDVSIHTKDYSGDGMRVQTGANVILFAPLWGAVDGGGAAIVLRGGKIICANVAVPTITGGFDLDGGGSGDWLTTDLDHFSLAGQHGAW